MSNYLGSPPRQWIIPVTRGCDRLFTIRRKDGTGALVNWDAAVYIDIDLDVPPIRVESDIDGALASFVLEASVCDQAKKGTKFRIVMSNDGVETPLAVGIFERYDG